MAATADHLAGGDEPLLNFLAPQSLPEDAFWLGWGAYAYQVYAPEVRTRRLDVFERAVLGVVRAGTMHPERVAEALELHPELVRLVLGQLVGGGYVDSKSGITDLGRAAWAAETRLSGAMTVGHVFQDPWSKMLWPVFATRLPQVRLRNRRIGLVAAEIGQHGSGRRIRVRLVGPTASEAAMPPSPDQILEACHRHRQRLLHTAGSQDDEDPSIVDRAVGRMRGQISLVSREPALAFLLTCAELDPTAEDEPWIVRDPVRSGASSTLRNVLRAVRPRHPGLEKTFAAWLGRHAAQQAAAALDPEPLVRAAARAEVDRRFPAVRLHEELRRSCVDLERLVQEGRMREGEGAELFRRPVVVQAQAVLERLFRELNRRWPAKGCWRRLAPPSPRARAQNERLIEAAARNAGFASPVPKRLLVAQPGRIRAAADHDQGSLLPRVVASLLTATTEPTHALRRAAQADPELLERIVTVATLRDEKAAHDGAGALTVAEVRAVVDTVYETIRLCLMELPQSPPLGTAIRPAV